MRAREFDNPKDTFVEMFRKFLPIAMKVIGLKSLPKMIFEKEVESPDQPTFGQYVNGEHILYVGLANRHPNDILRTIAHELVHYKQDTEHQLDGESGMTGSPEENQANAIAGVVMRHFNKQYPEYLRTKPIVAETWSDKYKRSINCANPKGFSQRAHCQGRKKNESQNLDSRDSMFYTGVNDPDGPRTHQDYRVTDKIDWSHPKLTTGMKYRIRADANLIPGGRKGLAATEKFYRDYEEYLLPHHKADVKRESAGDRGNIPTGPGEQLIPFPQGTTMVDVSDVYDWYKLGMVISDLDDADPKIFGQGAPHTVIAFGSEEEEHKLLPLLKRLGLSVHDIDRPEDVKKVIPAKMLAKDIAETIRKVGSQYRLVSKSGRNLGTYPTHAGAEKRERQVQYFKHVGENIPQEFPKNKAQSGITTNREPTWSFQEIAEKLGISIKLLNLLAFVKTGDFPEAVTGLASKYGSKKYYRQNEVKRWVNANNIREIIKQSIGENFADGRNPQDKGDSARHGIKKGMTIAQLKKIRSSDSASPRKKQLAHWQINMRQGQAK